MVTVRGLVSLVVVASAQVALAQPVPVPVKAAVPPLVGATELTKLTAPVGFIDDVVATDDQRIAYVIADTAAKSELHVVTLSTKAEQVVDLAPITLHPVALSLVGSRAFVVGVTEDGNQIAALVELTDGGKGKPAGRAVYKIGPAQHIVVITKDGKPRAAVHKATSNPNGTVHSVDLIAIENGKKLAGKTLELDSADKNKTLAFRVNHWSDGMTRAYGIKDGEWDKKEDQRATDSEVTYDVLTGKFVESKKIGDLFEQRKRFQALATNGPAINRLDFVRLAQDNSGIQVWKAGKARAIELDQPLTNYDIKSLQGVVNADGSAWLILKTDPVNPDAVARKKADPEYLDIFRIGSDSSKAVRKARVLATGVRHRFGVMGDKFWLIERNNGFERGGRSLALYSLQ